VRRQPQAVRRTPGRRPMAPRFPGVARSGPGPRSSAVAAAGRTPCPRELARLSVAVPGLVAAFARPQPVAGSLSRQGLPTRTRPPRLAVHSTVGAAPRHRPDLASRSSLTASMRSPARRLCQPRFDAFWARRRRRGALKSSSFTGLLGTRRHRATTVMTTRRRGRVCRILIPQNSCRR
jgi:hypothetical protein